MAEIVQLQPRLPSMSWMGELRRGERGAKAMLSNAVLIIGNDGTLSGMIAYNEFSYDVTMMRPPPPPYAGAVPAAGPYPRAITETDVSLIQSYIQRTFDMNISATIADQAVAVAAEQNLWHPVRKYLTSIQWDGKHRLATWLQTAFGVKDDLDYYSMIGTKFLVAAVARVFDPGCKFDTMLVLEGPQEIGKSRSCRSLFGAEFFSDELPDIKKREAPISMLGKWGIELSELTAIMGNATIEIVKAFLSRQVDRYREHYGRRCKDRPRQCVLIGTTNTLDNFGDATGNRRFWSVACEKAEHAWIAEMRDQLWAEAVHLYRAGETSLWLDDEDVRSVATQMQSARVHEEPWQVHVDKWILGRSQPVISNALSEAVFVPIEKQTKVEANRMARCFRLAGYESKVMRQDGKIVRRWIRTLIDPP